MFLSLQAGESTVHPMHYSVAFQFNQNISQSVFINITRSKGISKEQASSHSEHVMQLIACWDRGKGRMEKEREKHTECESIYSMRAHFKMLRRWY